MVTKTSSNRLLAHGVGRRRNTGKSSYGGSGKTLEETIERHESFANGIS